MPRIYRARLINIGYKDAFFDDVILPCYGLNSVVFAENGFGKSSMMGLLISVIRPYRREFLQGDDTLQEKRRIDDYVPEIGTSHVIIEWVTADRFSMSYIITGMVLERKYRSDISQTYYSLRYTEEDKANPDKALTFDSLPLTNGEGLLSLNEYISQLKTRRTDYPQQLITTFKGKGEWENHLLKYHIDTQLAKTVLKMNEKEGAQAKILSFRNDQEFISFIIDILEVYPREEDLIEVKESYNDLKLIPIFRAERELIQRLIPDLEVGAHLQQRLHILDNEMQSLFYEWKDAESTLVVKIAQIDQDIRKSETQIAEYNRSVDELSQKKDNMEIYKPFLEDQQRSVFISDNKEIMQNLRQKKTSLNHEIKLLDMLPIYRALKQLQDELKTKEDELNQKLGPITVRLSLARQVLYFHANKQLTQKKIEIEKVRTQKNEFDEKLNKIMNERTQIKTVIHENEKRIQQLQNRIDQITKKEEGLADFWKPKDGDLFDIIKKLEGNIAQFRLDQERNNKEIREIQDQKGKFGSALLGLVKSEEKVTAAISQLEQELRITIREYRGIICDQLFRNQFGEFQVPDVEHYHELDYTVLGKENQNFFNNKRTITEEEFFSEMCSSHELKRDVSHYDRHNSFPHNPALLKISETLKKQNINVQIGWDYLNNLIQETEVKKNLAQKIPHLLDGLIILGTPLEKVKTFFSNIQSQTIWKDLDHPIFISSSDIFEQVPKSDENFFILNLDLNYRINPLIAEERFNQLRTKDQKAAVQTEKLNRLRRDQETLSLNWQRFLREYPKDDYFNTLNQLSREEKKQEKIRLQKDNLNTQQLELSDSIEHLDEENNKVHSAIQTTQEKLMHLRHFSHDYALRQQDFHDQKECEGKIGEFTEKQESVEKSFQKLSLICTEKKKEYEKLEKSIQRNERRRRRYKTDKESLTINQTLYEQKVQEKPISHWESDYTELEFEYNTKISESGLGRRINRLNQDIEGKNQEITEALSLMSVTWDQVEQYYQEHISLENVELFTSKNRLRTDVQQLIQEETSLAQDNSKYQEIIKKNKPIYLRYLNSLKQQFSTILSDRKQLEEEIINTGLQLERISQELEECITSLNSEKTEFKNLQTQKHVLTMNENTIAANLHLIRGKLEDHKLLDYPGKDLLISFEEFQTFLEQLGKRNSDVLGQDEALQSEIDDFITQFRNNSQFMSELIRETSYSELINQFSRKDIRELDQKKEMFENRLQTLKKEIEEHENRLMNITSRFVQILDDILTKLKSLGRMTLPVPDLRNLDGKPIVRLNIRKGEYSDLQTTVNQYFVDMFAQEEKEFPPDKTSKHIINDIVHKHLESRKKPIRLLKIGKHQDSSYVTIPKAHLMSGGEKITIGILLFCLIAHYRLKYSIGRGGSRPSFTLFMDNPFGTASRLDLIKTQVNLASKLNIQLLPFSAVDSKNIYHYFPVFIPLKSDKRRGDEKLIEVDTKSEYFKVQASHIVIKEALHAQKDLIEIMERQKDAA